MMVEKLRREPEGERLEEKKPKGITLFPVSLSLL